MPSAPTPFPRDVKANNSPKAIRDAIREYLSVVEEQLRGDELREVKVVV
jgi:hypothetical protein